MPAWALRYPVRHKRLSMPVIGFADIRNVITVFAVIFGTITFHGLMAKYVRPYRFLWHFSPAQIAVVRRHYHDGCSCAFISSNGQSLCRRCKRAGYINRGLYRNYQYCIS